jgi:AcrR family transcriptional regulator
VRRATKPALRKVPLQARSKERLERLLDAAVREFAASGYEAATMEAVAARAGASIGSLYQFFPNKEALFHKVAEQYHERVREMFGVLLVPQILDLPWPVLIDRVIDTLWEFTFQQAGFRAIWAGGNLSSELLRHGEALNDEMTARTESVLQHYGFDKKRRKLVSTVVVETISMMIFVAGRRGDPLSRQLREETKLLVRRYLEAELPRR